MIEAIKQFDISLFRTINELSGQYPLLDLLMTFVSAKELWTAVTIGVVLYAWRVKRSDYLAIILQCLLALAASDLLSFEVLKPYFQRERPCWALEAVNKVQGFCGGSYSFTSNHAANASAVVTTLLLMVVIDIRLKFFAVFLAALVGFSRCYLGVHYPGDVFGGFILGACVAFVFHMTCLNKALLKLSSKLLSH